MLAPGQMIFDLKNKFIKNQAKTASPLDKETQLPHNHQLHNGRDFPDETDPPNQPIEEPPIPENQDEESFKYVGGNLKLNQHQCILKKIRRTLRVKNWKILPGKLITCF